jgi:RNA polymerase sigma-70 factor (family 1)
MFKKSDTDFLSDGKDQFKLVFESLYPVMCLYAKRFVNDSNIAEDISQEVFIELWRQREKFENYNQVKAFLYLSVKNKCLNFIKHQKVEATYVNEVLHTESEEDMQVIEAEVINQLTNAIESLPEQQKQVILHNLQGLKNEEIADAMQISVNTVKLHKKSAYQALRQKVNPTLLSVLLV